MGSWRKRGGWQMNEDVGRWVEELWMEKVVWKINGEW